jgi:acyl-CoA reductase-like NAD-dependent aldehyde dehydrogenase
MARTKQEATKGKRRRSGKLVALLIVGFMAFVVATAYVSGQRVRRAAEAERSPADRVDQALKQAGDAFEQTRERLDRAAREKGYESWPEMMREAAQQAETIRKSVEEGAGTDGDDAEAESPPR